MVYITSWAEYQKQAEELYEKSPTRTRYVAKWRASQGLLVLKITDDVTCLKYKTHSAMILNRFEALNLSLMRKMRNRAARPEPPPEATPTKTNGVDGAHPPAQPAGATGQSAGGGGAAKKKKKKGKK